MFLCFCLYLAGLVVCAKDGLDVDLLVSSSLDGWEEESDLCVRRIRQRQSLVGWDGKCVNLIQTIQDKLKDKDRHRHTGKDNCRDTYTERHNDTKKDLPTCFSPTQDRKPQ